MTTNVFVIPLIAKKVKRQQPKQMNDKRDIEGFSSNGTLQCTAVLMNRDIK